MNSLKEVYFAMAEQDHVKQAQAQAVQDHGPDFAEVDPELLKQAGDYDTIGRIMAHNVFGDMVKEAMDEGMPYASEDEKKKEVGKIMAKATGEKSDDDDDDDEDKESEEYKKKMRDKEEGGGGEGEEKKAAIKLAVLRRMQQDPEYVSQLLSKYNIG